MKFQLLHRAVKGTPVISLNAVTHVVHIRLLVRQIHNTRILPTAAATRPSLLLRSLPVAALLFSSPIAPCVTTVMRRGYWRADIRPANLKTVDADPSTSSPATTTSRPPQATSRRGFGPSDHNALSHRPPKSAIYSCQCGLIRETCLGRSSLID
jgi:hypothetical protein